MDTFMGFVSEGIKAVSEGMRLVSEKDWYDLAT